MTPNERLSLSPPIQRNSTQGHESDVDHEVYPERYDVMNRGMMSSSTTCKSYIRNRQDKRKRGRNGPERKDGTFGTIHRLLNVVTSLYVNARNGDGSLAKNAREVTPLAYKSSERSGSS